MLVFMYVQIGRGDAAAWPAEDLVQYSKHVSIEQCNRLIKNLKGEHASFFLLLITFRFKYYAKKITHILRSNSLIRRALSAVFQCV